MITSGQFKETQQFRQTWLFFLLFSVNAVLLYGLYSQTFLGLEFGDHPAPDYLLALFALIPVLVTVFIFIAKLETTIDKTGVRIRFFPMTFGEKRYDWQDVSSVRIGTYKPLWEYGGWGLRFGYKKRAYNVSGNQGMELMLNNGNKVTIGTQAPEEIRQFLATLPVNLVKSS